MRAPSTRRLRYPSVCGLAELNGEIDTGHSLPRSCIVTRAREEQMEVSVTPEQERWIATLIGSGRYEDTDDVVHEALRLLKEWEEDPVARLDALRRDIRAGLDEAERGELVDGEEVFKRAFDRIDRLQEKSA
jgi:antitoxin ParD1/3/4